MSTAINGMNHMDNSMHLDHNDMTYNSHSQQIAQEADHFENAIAGTNYLTQDT